MTRAADLAKLIAGSSTLGGTGELVLKDVDTADGSSPKITFQTGDTDIAADDVLGTIDFQAPDEGTGTDALLVAAGIEAVSEGDFSASSNATRLSFKTGASETATEKMTIKSDGNVGIGTSSPTGNLTVDGGTNTFIDLDKDDAGLAQVRFQNAGTLKFASWLNSDEDFHHYGVTGVDQIFSTGGTERMRINSSGEILIGTTSAPSAGSGGSAFKVDSNGRRNLFLSTSSSNNQGLIYFLNPNGEVGSITTNGSATAYNTSSDYRLKENVSNISDGITRVKQLAPKRFNFIADADTTLDGFLAHEAQTVVPEAVTGKKDDVDDDGNAVMQGIDQAKLVPLLTAALQEAIAKIETLETKVAALEAE